jgi:heptosyltransferase-2
VHYYRELLRGLGVAVADEPATALSCPADWAARGAALLGEGLPCVGINAGAAYGTAKRWLPDRFAAAADLLAKQQGLRPVLLGGPAERGLAEQIAASMTTPARVLCGETTLPELVGVLSRLGLLLTNDSGPMHVAAALGVPVLAVFGPTDWRETAPVGPRARLVREPVDCSPCMLRECPIDHRCMQRVGVERVVGEALDLLRRESRGGEGSD